LNKDEEIACADWARRKSCPFFVFGFAKSPTPDRSSGEKRTGRFITNALFAEVAKKRF